MEPQTPLKPPVLSYQRTIPPANLQARFISLHGLALALGCLSVLGFLAFPWWHAGASFVISAVSLLLGFTSRTCVAEDRTIRSLGIWISICGVLIFGFMTGVDWLITGIVC